LAAAAAAALTACGQQEVPVTGTSAAVDRDSGIALENMDTTIRPGDDFFSYVNGTWIANTEIPADKASYDGFSVLADQAQEDVRVIIEEAAAGEFPVGSDEQKVGDLYRSYTDMETRNAKGIMPLREELERIEAIGDHDDLAVYFAAANRRGYPVPVGIDQNEDFRDPERYMIYAWQNGLGLPDREYYFADDEVSTNIRASYPAHITAMFELAGFENGAAAAAEIMDLETRIAAAHITKEAARDWPANYNKVPLDQLNEVMPNFNWQGYIEEAGIGDIDGLVLMMTSYFEELDSVIAETPVDTWKTYLRWLVLNARANALDDALDKQDFEFYGKQLLGTSTQRAPWRRAVTAVNSGGTHEVVVLCRQEVNPVAARNPMTDLEIILRPWFLVVDVIFIFFILMLASLDARKDDGLLSRSLPLSSISPMGNACVTERLLSAVCRPCCLIP